MFSKTEAQFRPSAFAKPNLLELASTLARQRQDSNSDEPESFKIRDLFSWLRFSLGRLTGWTFEFY